MATSRRRLRSGLRKQFPLYSGEAIRNPLRNREHRRRRHWKRQTIRHPAWHHWQNSLCWCLIKYLSGFCFTLWPSCFTCEWNTPSSSLGIIWLFMPPSSRLPWDRKLKIPRDEVGGNQYTNIKICASEMGYYFPTSRETDVSGMKSFKILRTRTVCTKDLHVQFTVSIIESPPALAFSLYLWIVIQGQRPRQSSRQWGLGECESCRSFVRELLPEGWAILAKIFREYSGHVGERLVKVSVWLFKKPETFVSKIAQEHWVQPIPTGWIWLIRGGLTVEGDQDTWDAVLHWGNALKKLKNKKLSLVKLLGSSESISSLMDGPIGLKLSGCHLYIWKNIFQYIVL